MPAPDNSSSQILVSHAVLTGLTPLIPVPLVDDLFLSYFMRSMVRKLAAHHGKQLSSSEIETLVSQPGRGCALGCIGTVLLYPIKKIFRKIFFFLEWKRAADTISRTYYVGYLLDTALSGGKLGAANSDAARVRTAMDTVLLRTNTSLINRAALEVVGQSKGLLTGLVQLLLRNLPGGKPSEKDIRSVVDAVEAEEKDKLRGLVDQFQKALSTLPAQHLQQLRQEFAQEMARPAQPSSSTP